MITFFLQGRKEDSDEMIVMEKAAPLFSGEVVLDQRTGMIGTPTAEDDEQVLVIWRSMTSALILFLPRGSPLTSKIVWR